MKTWEKFPRGKRRKFIEIMSDPTHQGCKTNEEISKLVGINPATYYSWIREPELLRAAYDLYTFTLATKLPAVLDAAVKAAVKGDITAIKLIVEKGERLLGMYEDATGEKMFSFEQACELIESASKSKSTGPKKKNE